MAKSTAGARTRISIINAGLEIWAEENQPATTRAIGDRIGMTHAAILYHFKSATKLRDAIAEEAVRLRNPIIVPQLLVMKHPAAAQLSEVDRVRFLMGC